MTLVRRIHWYYKNDQLCDDIVYIERSEDEINSGHWITWSTPYKIKHILKAEPVPQLVQLFETILDESKSYVSGIYMMTAVSKTVKSDNLFRALEYTRQYYMPSSLPFTAWLAILENCITLSKTDFSDVVEKFFSSQFDVETLKSYLKKIEVVEFDPSILDCLDGKITSEKMIDWGVGQIMKQYPKKYKPADIRQAIMQRFSF